jgi:predicted house-cleaning noncanonical NTP pyrophosphatase (MazG superfamily)
MKLVRDRVPAIMAAAGQAGTFHVADPAEYQARLRAKLLEEAAEAATASTPAALLEELGDVLQVLYDLAVAAGSHAAQVEAVRARKAAVRGGFARGLVWHGPTHPTGSPAARPTSHPRASEVLTSVYSDTHLLLGSEPAPPEVYARQHPDHPDSFTVALDTADRRGHLAITGTPSQLIQLLGRMTQAVTEVATAAGQLPSTQQPVEPATTST